MSASTVIFYFKICFTAFFLLLFSYQSVLGSFLKGHDEPYAKLLFDSGTDIIRSTYSLLDEVEYIKQNHLNTPAFEVGYLMFTIFEKYRKMIDKYNSSITLNRKHYNMELLMYLEEIEHHHWEVEHLANMLHEIERKYGVATGLKTKYRELTSKEKNARLKIQKHISEQKKMASTKRYKIKKAVLDRLSPRPPPIKPTPFLFDYGWEIDYEWRKK